MLASGKLPPDALPGDLAGQVRDTIIVLEKEILIQQTGFI